MIEVDVSTIVEMVTQPEMMGDLQQLAILRTVQLSIPLAVAWIVVIGLFVRAIVRHTSLILVGIILIAAVILTSQVVPEIVAWNESPAIMFANSAFK